MMDQLNLRIIDKFRLKRFTIGATIINYDDFNIEIPIFLVSAEDGFQRHADSLRGVIGWNDD